MLMFIIKLSKEGNYTALVFFSFFFLFSCTSERQNVKGLDMYNVDLKNEV